MKSTLFLFLVLFDVTCYCQTQDIYLHNGDEYWNQQRLQADKNLEYLREINAIKQKKLDETIALIKDAQSQKHAADKEQIQKCANNLNQIYSSIQKYVPVYDGENIRVYLNDNETTCSDAMVNVSNGKVSAIGSNYPLKIIWSSDVVNQKAKVNASVAYEGKTFTYWFDVYFLFSDETQQPAQTKVQSQYNVQPQVFYEDFADNHRKWDADTDKTEECYIKNGRYYIKVNEVNSWHWFAHRAEFDNERNWTMESTISLNKIEGYRDFFGILLGAKDSSNMFQFIYYPNVKSAKVQVIKEGNWYTILPELKLDSLLQSKIKFTISKTGNQCYYYINELLIGKSEAYEFFGDKVGFVAAGKITISVNDLSIKSNL